MKKQSENLAENIIESFYEEEAIREAMEAQEFGDTLESKKITLKAPAPSVLMLNAICQRFGKTRFEICEPLLADFVQHLFCSLNPKDREELALSVDEEITPLVQKFNVQSVGAAGSFKNEFADWRHLSATLTSMSSKKESK